MPEQKESFIRGISILTIALITGVVVFFIIGVVLTLIGFVETNALKEISTYIFIGLSFVAILVFIGYRNFFNKKINAIKNTAETTKEKLNLYRSALIKCLAAFEGIALFSVILFMLTGNYWFGGIVLLMLFAMLSNFPTRQRVIDQLGLDWNEQQEL